MSERFSFSERCSEGYQTVVQLEKYVRKTVDHRLLELVKLRVSILNGCTFCVDMHSQDAIRHGEDVRRLFGVAAWREAPFFDSQERAALALTDAVTRLPEGGVPDDVWDEVVKHWSEESAANLVLAIGTINLWNRIGVTTRRQPAPL